MKVSGGVIIKIAGRAVNAPIEAVILKRTMRVKESGDPRETLTRIDKRNIQELFEVENTEELLPVINLGAMGSILDTYLKHGG